MWRLVADLMNDIGMLMDLLSPLFPSAFIVVVCLGSLSRSFSAYHFLHQTLKLRLRFGLIHRFLTFFQSWLLAGVASGATRAALTQHFALQDNAADISAKEGSQETMATMMGMSLGMLLARFTSGNPMAIWLSFLSLTVFHMYGKSQMKVKA
jgi:hypothetical protein